MRSILALSLAGSTVALPWGLDHLFERSPEPFGRIPPPDFRPTRRPHPHPSGSGNGFPFPTGSGIFPTATGSFPTASGGEYSILPFPEATKTLSLDYGLAPTFTPEPVEEADEDLPEDLPEGEDDPSFTLVDPEPTPTEVPELPEETVFPTLSIPLPSVPAPSGGFPTGIFPTGVFPTGGSFPTGAFPTGVYPTGFPGTGFLTSTRRPGPKPTAAPELPAEPTEEEWKAWWERWLEWAREFIGWGKGN